MIPVSKKWAEKLALLLNYKNFVQTSFSFYLSDETCLNPNRQAYKYGQPFTPDSFTLTISYLTVIPTGFLQQLVGFTDRFYFDNLSFLQLRQNLTDHLSVLQLQQVLLGLTCSTSLVLFAHLERIFLSLKT